MGERSREIEICTKFEVAPSARQIAHLSIFEVAPLKLYFLHLEMLCCESESRRGTLLVSSALIWTKGGWMRLAEGVGVVGEARPSTSF